MVTIGGAGAVAVTPGTAVLVLTALAPDVAATLIFYRRRSIGGAEYRVDPLTPAEYRLRSISEAEFRSRAIGAAGYTERAISDTEYRPRVLVSGEEEESS
jgi:hypothetical protein